MLGMEEEERGCLVCSFIALNRAEFRHHMKDRHQININIRKLKNVPKTLQMRKNWTIQIICDIRIRQSVT